jgi:nonribosomal peptide synthetase DhbF
VIGSAPGDDAVVPIGRPISKRGSTCLTAGSGCGRPACAANWRLVGLPSATVNLGPSPCRAFVANPWLSGRTMYLTGDVGNMRQGVFFYHGRRGSQVKLAGRWVEPSEIENACLAISGVVSAAACVAQIGSSKTLVAVVVGQSASTTDTATRLALILPRYMVPSRIVVVDSIPLTANGEVDRAALALPLNQRKGRR